MNGYFYVIISFLIAGFVWDQLLSYLNRRQMSSFIPEPLWGIYDEDKYMRQQAYQKVNSRFGLVSGSFSFLILLAVLWFGGLGWLDNYLRSFIDNEFLLPLCFFGLLLIANQLIALPFDWYATFVIEERFGFNKTTPGVFVADALKGLLLSVLLGGAILCLILFIYQYTTTWFWLLAWIAISLFSLVINIFYSEWIVPLFNKQTPLEEGALRDAIEAFSRKAGFELKNIYVIDGSKRSTKANAYFAGMGKKKRIVLYDTLIQELETEEIVAVLAHEVGHYKKKHIWQSLVLSTLSTGLILYILSLFLDNAGLAEALGGTQASFHLGLIGFSFLFSPISELSGLFFNVLSRKNEYEADAYAAGFGLSEALISGLKKISVKALSNLNPHPWVVFWHYSHPTLLQRIRRLNA